MTGTEHGDRERFLAPARGLLSEGIHPNPVHVPPPTPLPSDPVPEARYLNLDPGDLVTSFADAVAHAEGVCHVVEDDVPDSLLDRIVAELGERDDTSVVVSTEPEARAVGDRLAARGLAVDPGDARDGGSRRVGRHVRHGGDRSHGFGGPRQPAGRRPGGVPAAVRSLVRRAREQVVRDPADVLRRLGSAGEAPPPSLVVVTGPSRTGDIEQLLTLGAHGPTALHVVLLTDGQSGSPPSGPAAG